MNTNQINKNEENILHSAKIHWFIFVLPAVLLLLSFGFWLFGSGGWAGLGVVLGITAAYSLFSRLTYKFGVSIVITNKRVIFKSGILKRDSLDLMLDKCEGIRSTQSIIGRIFNFGTLFVTTGGVSHEYKFIEDSECFRAELMKQR